MRKAFFVGKSVYEISILLCMCNTSRIDNMHKILKLYLNSSTHLVEFFTVFETVEKQSVEKFHNEIQKSKANDRKKFQNQI